MKYVCQHKVTKRVRLKKVLNPRAWSDRSTYLRAQVEEMDDSGGAGDWDKEGDPSSAYAADVAALCADMDAVVDLQNSFKEEPRFSPSLKGVFSPGDFLATPSQAPPPGAEGDKGAGPDSGSSSSSSGAAAEGGAGGAEEGAKAAARALPADDRLWAMAALWQTFASERVSDVQRRGTAEV